MIVVQTIVLILNIHCAWVQNVSIRIFYTLADLKVSFFFFEERECLIEEINPSLRRMNKPWKSDRLSLLFFAFHIWCVVLVHWWILWATKKNEHHQGMKICFVFYFFIFLSSRRIKSLYFSSNDNDACLISLMRIFLHNQNRTWSRMPLSEVLLLAPQTKEKSCNFILMKMKI